MLLSVEGAIVDDHTLKFFLSPSNVVGSTEGSMYMILHQRDSIKIITAMGIYRYRYKQWVHYMNNTGHYKGRK